MQIIFKELRSLVNKIIIEEMFIPPTNKNWALFVGNNCIIAYVLDFMVMDYSFEPEKVMPQIVKSKRFREDLNDSLEGVIFIRKETIPFDNQKASEVEYVASTTDGLGPFLYDCAMKFFGPITHNDGPTSNDAWNVWDFYRKNRKELVVKTFSKKELNKAFTQSELDPKKIHIVVAGANPNTTEICNIHDNFASFIAKNSGITIEEYENILTDVAYKWVNEKV